MTTFDEGEKAQMEKIIKETLPDEQKKCTAWRIFEKDVNVERLFDGFNKIQDLTEEIKGFKIIGNKVQELVSELQEHKQSHQKMENDIKLLKRHRWLHKGYSFLGSGIGAFIAIIIKKKLEG